MAREELNMEFEFNLGEQNITPTINRDQTLYASVPGSVAQLSNEELVFLEHEHCHNHVMTMTVLNSLSLTRQFRTLHEHTQVIQQAIPELRGQVGAIEKVLGFLKSKNLLISAEQWIDKIKNSSVKDHKEVPYVGIVVRTHHRPESLKRLLDSIEQYAQQHGRDDTVMVYDDSTDAKLIKDNQDVCHGSKLKVQYFGETWQQQFSSMLIESFPAYESQIKWLLDEQEGFTGGRVWNYAMLALAGKKFAFFDDDFLIQPRVSPSSNIKQISLIDTSDLNVGFGLNIRDIKESSVSYTEDILGQMIDSCGQGFGDWLKQNDSIEINPFAGRDFSDLQRIDEHSQIKTIGQGTWGSPRATSNYWLYFLTGDQQEAFWKDRTVYLDNIEASHLLHYSNSIESLGLTRFAPSVIDNSTLGSFAMPTEANEDHFFNSLMLGCYPNQVSLHYPHMMGHVQAESRDRSQMNHVALRGSINRFVGDYILSVYERFDSHDPEKRMHALAASIDDLATSSDQKIENRLREYRNQLSADLVMRLQQQLLDKPEAPIYWQADVRDIIEANAQFIKSNDVPRLGGWDENEDFSESLNQLRKQLLDISSAMKIWPSLWSFCSSR